MNGADCMVQPPDSTAMIRRPFEIMYFPSSAGMYLHFADRSFVRNPFAVFFR